MSTVADPTDPPVPVTEPGRRGPSPWPLVTRLHFYGGVLVAPFLVVALLTGLAYAFTPQLDRLVYGDVLHTEQAAGAPRPLAEQVRAARAAHPEGTVSAVVVPEAGDTTQVVLSVPELEPEQRTVYVDPYTGRVTGALTTDFGSTPVATWLGELHRCLHLGKVGSLYSELAASWLWVIAAGGLLLWLGRRRRYRGGGHVLRVLWPRRSGRGLRRTRARHATVGLWLAPGLLMLSLTGLTWTDHAGARFDALQANVASTPPELDTGAGGGGGHHQHGTGGAANDPSRHIDHVVATARGAGLTGPVEAEPPAGPGAAWTVEQVDGVWPVRKDKVAVDTAAGRVTDRVDWAEHPVLAKLSTLGIQFHMGRLFGIANQLLMAAIALGLLALLTLGYRMWWRRRPTRGERKAPFGRPPERGAWRRFPRPALLLPAVTAIAVGWALPVLGVSLLAFLALDAAIGLVSRRARPQ